MTAPITKINPRGIDTTGDFVVNSLSSTGNVSAGNVKTDHLLYANGTAYSFATNAAGTNTQIQFNDGNSFSGNANLTFNKVTGTLTVSRITSDGANISNVNALTLNGHSDTYFATSVQGSKADTAIQSGANISVFTNDTGYITAANLSTYATQSYVGNAISNLVASAPAALDTLNELANALGNDANYSTTITNALANKLSTSNFASTANTWISTQTTSNLSEGTNLYYTVARANSAIDARVTKSFVDALAVTANIANIAYSVSGSNVSGQVANALVAGTVYTNAQPNITSVGTLVSVEITGNANVGATLRAVDVIATGNIVGGSGSGGNISGANVITANYFVGNGSLLTGLPAGYANSNIANYLPTYTGNLTAGNVLTDHLLYANGTAYAFSSSASGSNTQIQFNDGNSFAGNAGLTFDKTTTTLTANNFVSTTSANLGSVANVHITGGSTSQLLQTDGTGNLTWVTPTGSTIAVDNFTGNGVQTAFTLSSSPSSSAYTIVALAGTIQPRSIYTVSGTTLTFSSPPPNTAPIEVTTFTSVLGYGSGNITANVISANTLTANTLSGNIISSNANLTVNTLTANSVVNGGSGTPTLQSNTSIVLSAATVVRVSTSPMQFYTCTTTVRDTIAASNGYVIYNTTTNKLQVYANGAWADLN